MSPSSVLEILQHNRIPQRFTVEAYVQLPEESIDIHIRANGAYEGNSPETVKGKIDLSISAVSPTAEALITTKAIVRGTMLYMQFVEIVADDADVDPAIIGRWFSADLAEELDQQEASLEMLFASEEFNEEDMKQLIRIVHDSIFQMESSLFDGGASYKLMLRKDFLLSMVRNICTSSIIDCENELGFGSLAEVEGELVGLQQELSDKLNISYKVDTDRANNLQFARMYMSLAWPNVVTMSFQGETHNLGTPVYLDIPANAVPAEQFVQETEPYKYWHFGVDPEWTDEEWSDEDWSDDIEWEDADWSSDEWDDIQWEEEDDSAWDDMEWEELPVGCTAEPGTAQYLQQARKGECPLPEEIRPGRGDLRRLR
jgi:hypothetical protein